MRTANLYRRPYTYYYIHYYDDSLNFVSSAMTGRIQFLLAFICFSSPCKSSCLCDSPCALQPPPSSALGCPGNVRALSRAASSTERSSPLAQLEMGYRTRWTVDLTPQSVPHPAGLSCPISLCPLVYVHPN